MKTAMQVEAQVREKRQRFMALKITNSGRKYSLNYVDCHGVYHLEQGGLNRINAKNEQAIRQAQYPGLTFEILPEDAQ